MQSVLVPNPEKPDVAFVACIEGGVLEAQTLLLFDSIRHYAGRFSDCSLYAFSPRAGHAISNDSRRTLDEQGVTYVDKILNTECPEYGSANRVAAAAHVEDTWAHDLLVILDSDTLFLRDPAELVLPPDIDAAVRPVDIKGMSTGGPSDSCDRYWRDLCRCCGVDYDQVPWRESFVDRQRIKANYNGGLIVVRRSLGILRRWADFFFQSIREGLKPHTNAESFRTGAGWIKPAAANLWGSNQAALSLAIWSSTRRVQELPATYNYPLHLHNQIDAALARRVFPELVHVHYHALFAPDAFAANPLLQAGGPLSASQRNWLRAATPIA
ncbi:MAG: hypothetical protein ABJA18_03260 [bacterium]